MKKVTIDITRFNGATDTISSTNLELDTLMEDWVKMEKNNIENPMLFVNLTIEGLPTMYRVGQIINSLKRFTLP